MIDVQQMTRGRREAVANRIGLPGMPFAALTMLVPPAPLARCLVDQRVNNSPQIRPQTPENDP
jgi:hypothetical protein